MASPKASATTNTEAGRAAAERAAARQAARIEAAHDEALIENQRRNDPFRIGLGRNSSPAFERGPSGVTSPAPKSGAPTRPTWQTAQAGPKVELSDFAFEPEPTFLGGEPAPYGTPGSVRPDYASTKMRLSVDVKNYDVTTSGGRYRLVKNIIGQTARRAANLPEGMRQGVWIDIRGQVVSEALLERMLARITKRSGGLIQPENIYLQR